MNGENTFLFGETAKEMYDFLKNGYIIWFEFFEQYYTEMEYNMITEEAQRYINDNGLGNELHDIVFEWLIDNSRVEPNFVDYSEVELNEYLQK